jgi:hypothetical protein
MLEKKDKLNLSEKIAAFREKRLKTGKPEKVTREMTEDLLTMQRECVEADHDLEEIDTVPRTSP